MNKKTKYKQENEAFLEDLLKEDGIIALPKGMFYKVLENGDGKQAAPKRTVSVYYKGKLIDGKTFDDNTKDKQPATFRLSELIESWQIAIPQMREGDKWEIYVPAALGYGSRGTHGIPGDSTLIFEIKLVKVF